MSDIIKFILHKIYKFVHGIREKFFPSFKAKEHPFINNLIGKIMSLKYSKIVTTEGIMLYLDELDSLALSYSREYEPEETRFFKNNVKLGDRIIDIGANIGYYTTLFSKLIGKDGEVIAFEPDPLIFHLLNQNLEANNCKNCKSINMAVSNENGYAELVSSEFNRGDNRINKNSTSSENDVKIVSIDNFMGDENKVSIIKMDIQGHEYQALLGMRNTLQNNQLILVFEFWPSGLIGAGTEPVDILIYLWELGYNIVDMERPNEQINEHDYKDWYRGIIQHVNVVAYNARKPMF